MNKSPELLKREQLFKAAMEKYSLYEFRTTDEEIHSGFEKTFFLSWNDALKLSKKSIADLNALDLKEILQILFQNLPRGITNPLSLESSCFEEFNYDLSQLVYTVIGDPSQYTRDIIRNRQFYKDTQTLSFHPLDIEKEGIDLTFNEDDFALLPFPFVGSCVYDYEVPTIASSFYIELLRNKKMRQIFKTRELDRNLKNKQKSSLNPSFVRELADTSSLWDSSSRWIWDCAVDYELCSLIYSTIRTGSNKSASDVTPSLNDATRYKKEIVWLIRLLSDCKAPTIRRSLASALLPFFIKIISNEKNSSNSHVDILDHQFESLDMFKPVNARILYASHFLDALEKDMSVDSNSRYGFEHIMFTLIEEHHNSYALLAE